MIEIDVQELSAKGRTAPLARDEYLAVQDFLWRHILLEAGKITLAVHIHSSLGVPPFLRSSESDVRNLEDVLADGDSCNADRPDTRWHTVAVATASMSGVTVAPGISACYGSASANVCKRHQWCDRGTL